MVSLLILFGHFAPFSFHLSPSLSVHRFLSVSFNFVHTFLAIAHQFSKYKIATIHSKKCAAFEWDFHYACSNKTNGKSTYGNQVTSKNDLISTTKYTPNSLLSRHCPMFVSLPSLTLSNVCALRELHAKSVF